jgi:HSP20 family protein
VTLDERRYGIAVPTAQLGVPDMPVRWRRVTARSVGVVSLGGLSPGDLLALAGSSPLVAPTRWRPATDVCETPSSVIVTIELAGVREDELDIALYPDAVLVDGYRRPEAVGADAVYQTLQIWRGPFRLAVPLPATVDTDRTDVNFGGGMLQLTLARRSGGAPADDG